MLTVVSCVFVFLLISVVVAGQSEHQAASDFQGTLKIGGTENT
jgi:hypothetical protein